MNKYERKLFNNLLSIYELFNGNKTQSIEKRFSCVLFLCIVRQENIYVRMNIVKENIIINSEAKALSFTAKHSSLSLVLGLIKLFKITVLIAIFVGSLIKYIKRTFTIQTAKK